MPRQTESSNGNRLLTLIFGNNRKFANDSFNWININVTDSLNPKSRDPIDYKLLTSPTYCEANRNRWNKVYHANRQRLGH